MATDYCLATADVDWQDTTPRSGETGDIYWSAGNPLAEKSRCFLEQHDLVSRGAHSDHLTLVETGFGFGNNFLLTAKAWRDSGVAATLHYIAVEGFPVSKSDLLVHLQNLKSENLPHAEWLAQHYPAPLRTWFNLKVADNIYLLLIFDDVIEALQDLDAKVDAWYLDGFAPRLNPGMWSPAVFKAMQSLSCTGATVSTYSVARDVREGLNSAGFDVEKKPGHGSKSEMLVATAKGQWLGHRWPSHQVVVLGAGLAGNAARAALVSRGFEVCTVDRMDPNTASGLPAYTVYPQLTVHAETRARFSLSASHFAGQVLPGYQRLPLHWYSQDVGRQARMQRIAKQLPDEFVSDGLVFHAAGIQSIDPHVDLDAEVVALDRAGSSWRLSTSVGELEADIVVVALGIASQSLFPTLPMKPMRGQSIEVSAALPSDRVVSGDVSVLPLVNGDFLVGSTYGPGDNQVDERDVDTAELLRRFALNFPDVDVEVIRAYTGVRASVSDRFPIVGPMQLGTGSQPSGLFVLTGLGSRGATHAPIGGEIIARRLTGEPQPVGQSAQRLLAPERFGRRVSG